MPSTPPSTRPDLAYVVVKTVRERAYHYFRLQRDGRERFERIRGAPGSPEYFAHYAELRAAADGAQRTPKPAGGSVGAMIEAFLAAPEFTGLAAKTQRDYRHALDTLRALAPFPARAILRADVLKLRNKVQTRSGPRAADLFVAVARRCFGVGADLGFVERSPVERVARLAVPESYAPWPREVRDAFEASGPPPHLLTAYMLALWTAARIGDVVTLGRQHDDGTALTYRPAKTRRSSGVESYVPVFSALRRHIETLPAGRMLYVARADGAPCRSDTLAKELRAHLAGLGIEGYSFHGLKHTTGDALADAGASTHEIQAILNHTTLQMAERYTRRADRRGLAVSGMAKLERRERERNGKQGNSSGAAGKHSQRGRPKLLE